MARKKNIDVKTVIKVAAIVIPLAKDLYKYAYTRLRQLEQSEKHKKAPLKNEPPAVDEEKRG